MTPIQRFFGAVLLLVSGLTQAQQSAPTFSWTGSANDVPLPAEEAFVVTWRIHGNAVEVQVQAKPGYYVYRRALTLLNDQQPLSFTHNPGVTHYDEHFGDVEVFFEPLFLKANTSKPPERLTLRFQGCKKDSICYPPMQRMWVRPATPSRHAPK